MAKKRTKRAKRTNKQSAKGFISPHLTAKAIRSSLMRIEEKLGTARGMKRMALRDRRRMEKEIAGKEESLAAKYD